MRDWSGEVVVGHAEFLYFFREVEVGYPADEMIVVGQEPFQYELAEFPGELAGQVVSRDVDHVEVLESRKYGRQAAGELVAADD
jgi:hypothetical protein